MFLLALVSDMYRPAAQAMISDLVEPLRRPYAFTLMYIAINLGFALGPPIAGVIAERSFALVFYGDAATTLLYACILLFCVSETLARMSAITGDAGRSPQDATPAPITDTQLGLRAALVQIFRDAVFVRFCAATFCLALVYVQCLSTLPLYLRSRGLGEFEIGRIIATNGLLIVLVQLPMTSFVARLDRGLALFAASLLTTAGFLMHAFMATELQFMVAVVFWTFGEMMQSPLYGPIVSDLAPLALRARYLGILTVCYSGANMIGAPLGGLVLEHLGGPAVWYASAVLGLLAGALFLHVRPYLARASTAAVTG
jgi:MFS family permease